MMEEGDFAAWGLCAVNGNSELNTFVRHHLVGSVGVGTVPFLLPQETGRAEGLKIPSVQKSVWLAAQWRGTHSLC